MSDQENHFYTEEDHPVVAYEEEEPQPQANRPQAAFQAEEIFGAQPQQPQQPQQPNSPSVQVAYPPVVPLHDDDHIPNTQDGPASSAKPTFPVDTRVYKAHELRYYRFLFDVTAKQVLERCLWASIPYPVRFFDAIGEKADLYGPFWIATTLVFLIQALGNITRWLETDNWSYDFTKLGAAAATIYVYLGLTPVLMWAILKYFKLPVALPPIVALYGYSFFLYIPASFLSVIPIVYVRWIVIFFAAALSTATLFTNLFFALKDYLAHAITLLTVFGLLHLGFAFACEFYFFEF